MFCDVLLEIPDYSTDVWRIVGSSGHIVDDLVAGKKAKCVGIVLESLHDRKRVLEVRGGVCARRVTPIKRLT